MKPTNQDIIFFSIIMGMVINFAFVIRDRHPLVMDLINTFIG